jgi:hypothetical protein
MIFSDLIQRNVWENIAKRFVEIFPEQEKNLDGYEYVFFLTPTLKKEETNGMCLCIRHGSDGDICKEDGCEWEDIYGVDGSLQRDHEDNLILDENGNTRITTWALELNPWGYWANLDIDEESLRNYGDIDFICYALYEMTFFGFDQQDVIDQRNELDRRCKSIDDGTAVLIPWEDVKKHLEELKESWKEEEK